MGKLVDGERGQPRSTNQRMEVEPGGGEGSVSADTVPDIQVSLLYKRSPSIRWGIKKRRERVDVGGFRRRIVLEATQDKRRAGFFSSSFCSSSSSSSSCFSFPWLGTRRRGGVNKEARSSERQTLLIRDEKANPRLSPASCVVCGIGIRCAAM